MEEEEQQENGLWKETKDPYTGKSSIQLHTLKTVLQSCKEADHFFEFAHDRELICTKCGITRYIIIGLYRLVDGKIIENG